MKAQIFNIAQKKFSEDLLKDKSKIALKSLSSKEIQNLGIAWSYYSARIEGNAYSNIEADILLRDKITAAKEFDDAQMLVNFYDVLISELNAIRQGRPSIIIDQQLISTIHMALVRDLEGFGEPGKLRQVPVKISGTTYQPPEGLSEIKKGLNAILKEQNIENPFEKAVFLHCNLAKLQPFIDGNKRVARLVESIILMQADYLPVYSFKQEDILAYRRSLLHYYETGDYSCYADYLLNHIR